VIWQCPNCQEALFLSQSNSVQCPKGHCFDRAKQGYYNLLLDNHKNSQTPGDSPTMMAARRRFLSSGYYAPLAKNIAELILPNSHIVADIGCGEGYYLQQILSQLGDQHSIQQAYATDISKTAIQRAAAQFARLFPCEPIHVAVASNYRLPFLNHSVDSMFVIFAPLDEAEAWRVIKPNGQLIRVTPGEQHLYEIKAKIYRQFMPHKSASPIAGFELKQQQRCQFTLSLAGDIVVDDLIAMTPLQWRGNPQAKAGLRNTATHTVTCDFVVQDWRCIVE